MRRAVELTHDLLLAARAHADRIVALHQGYITDNIRCEQLQPEEMSEPLKRQWQALPELSRYLCRPERE